MKRCDWCGEECSSLLPVENRDTSVPVMYVWVCSECVEAVRGEYWCELCSPIGFRVCGKRPATLESRRVVDLVESFS